MKPFTSILFALLAIAGSRLAAQEAKSDPPPPPNIFVEMQIVAIPREVALPLVRDLMDKDKIEPAYARIQELLEKKTAKLIGWPMLTTLSGNRATLEAVQEFRYAAEYNPAVAKYYLPDGTEPTQLGDKLPPGTEKTEFHGLPTAFEVRNTGIELDVNPTASVDGKTISLVIIPQHTRLNRMTKSTIELEKTHEKVVVEQPAFDTIKTNSTLTLKSGERILSGVYLSPEFPDFLELFILRAEARKVP